jgi:hypothetical protein
MSVFGSGSNSNGQFWYGKSINFPGFLYKKNVGVGGRRSTKFNPGGNTTCNKSRHLYNKYKPGTGGVGANSIATRRAKNRHATVCEYSNCFPCYMSLGQYSNYTHNPNGFYPCLVSNDSNNKITNPCDLLPKITPYQLCSPWPHFGGLDNTNSRYTPILGSQSGNVNLLNTTNNFYVINTSPVIASDGTIYVGVNQNSSIINDNPIQGYLFAYNPNGTLKWYYTLQKTLYNPALLSTFNTSTPTVGSDGTIYFGTGINNPGYQGAGPVGSTFVYAINPNGTLKWLRNDIVPIDAPQPPNNACNSVIITASLVIGSDNNLYFGCNANSSRTPQTSSSLFSLNSTNGNTNWEFSLSSIQSVNLSISEIPDSVAIDNNGNVYFICWNRSYNNLLVYLISLTSGGTFRYICDLNNGNTNNMNVYGRPVLSVDNSVVYAMTYLNNYPNTSNYLYSINAESGTVSLIRTISFISNGISLNNSMCRDKNNNLYFSIVSDYNAVLYSVNKYGIINWSYTINAPSGSSVGIIDNTPAIGSDGTIYFQVLLTDYDNFGSYYIYAINPNGTLKWYKLIPNVSNSDINAVITSLSINLQGNIIVSLTNASNISTITYSNLYSLT